MRVSNYYINKDIGDKLELTSRDKKKDWRIGKQNNWREQ